MLLSLSIDIMVLCDNLTSSGQTVLNIKHYAVNDFPWGEYKDWSTNGTWYSIAFYCFVYKHCNNRFCYRFAIFKIFTEIPSLPVALLTLILFICFSTNEVSIDSNLVMFWNDLYTWMFLIYSTDVFYNVFSYINKKNH